MALELQLIKHHKGILIPAIPEISEILQTKIRLDDVVVADSNGSIHRRFVALMNIGCEYREPSGGAIPSNECKILTVNASLSEPNWADLANTIRLLRV